MTCIDSTDPKFQSDAVLLSAATMVAIYYRRHDVFQSDAVLLSAATELERMIANEELKFQSDAVLLSAATVPQIMGV